MLFILSHKPLHSRVKQLLNVCLLSLSLGTSASASEICAGFTELSDKASSGFADLQDAEQMAQTTDFLPETKTCSISKQLSGSSELICFWQFDYRAESATTQFISLYNQLDSCQPPNKQDIRDQKVNHPDYYDLRTFENNGTNFSVSLKDKAALDQTFVFFRIAKRNEP